MVIKNLYIILLIIKFPVLSQVNDNKSESENLNTRGMYFDKIDVLEPSLGLISK